MTPTQVHITFSYFETVLHNKSLLSTPMLNSTASTKYFLHARAFHIRRMWQTIKKNIKWEEENRQRARDEWTCTRSTRMKNVQRRRERQTSESNDSLTQHTTRMAMRAQKIEQKISNVASCLVCQNEYFMNNRLICIFCFKRNATQNTANNIWTEFVVTQTLSHFRSIHFQCETLFASCNLIYSWDDNNTPNDDKLVGVFDGLFWHWKYQFPFKALRII